jgi:pimeloyl-[acyl-carrier protein] synthase
MTNKHIESSGVDPSLTLFQLLDPEYQANPYPLYRRLQTEDPVHWDPFLHSWVLTKYSDALTAFQNYSAERLPSFDELRALGLKSLIPLTEVMQRQMLFRDPPAQTRLRTPASRTFTPRRVEALRAHIQEITDSLLDQVQANGKMDVVTDFAQQLPAIVTTEFLGVPASDRHQLRVWSEAFAEVLGNFQHNSERASEMIRNLDEMTAYFRAALKQHRAYHSDDVIGSYLHEEAGGDRLDDDEMVANIIIVMVGGQETTTNLIGSGLLSLLQNPDQLQLLREQPDLMPSAIEELLRYESPIQYTVRVPQEDTSLRGKSIRQNESVIVVMGAANRDPERFPDPDRLDLRRPDNRHVAFAWASHFCFGAPLARVEGQVAFETILRRMPNLALTGEPLSWRSNLSLRGLTSLPVTF